MRSNKMFFLFFLISFFVRAQEINRFDTQGNRHGFWEKRYDSGRVRYTGTFDHGKEVGVFFFYQNKFINNFPSIKKNFDKLTNKASVVFYDIYGKIKTEGVLIGKKRTGVWKYYDHRENLILIEQYLHDQLNGKRTVFYENGHVAELSNYKNNTLEGITSRFSKDGVKLNDMTYKGGLLHGRTKFFEVNGNLKETGLYYKDHKVDPWDFYYKGRYMGTKENVKKKRYALDLENSDTLSGKELVKIEYSVDKDKKILENIAFKMEAKIKEVKKLAEADALKSRQAKEAKQKKGKLTDVAIMKNINAKRKKNTVHKSKLSDEEILANIKKKHQPSSKENK